MANIISNIGQLKIIVPNLRGKISTYKARRALFIAMIPTCFVCFGLGGALCGITENLGFIALALCGFFGLPASVFLLINSVTKLSMVNHYIYVIETIEREDKLLLRRLMGIEQNDLVIVNTIKKLIETGNLPNYHIVADVMVVRDGVYVSEDEALEEQQRYLAMNPFFGVINGQMAAKAYQPVVNNPISSQDKALFCSSCGKAVPEDAAYCPYCGSRIYKDNL